MSRAHVKRPLSVTLFAPAVLLLAAYNAWRAIVAAQQFEFMQGLGIGTPAGILMVIGAAWAAGFAIAALGLWRLQAWGRRWMLIAIVAYEADLWIARLTLERTSYEQLTRPLDAAISLLIVIGVWGFLCLPGIRRAYRSSKQS